MGEKSSKKSAGRGCARAIVARQGGTKKSVFYAKSCFLLSTANTGRAGMTTEFITQITNKNMTTTPQCLPANRSASSCDGCGRTPPFGAIRPCRWNARCTTNWCDSCIDAVDGHAVLINDMPHCAECMLLYYGLFWRDCPFFTPIDGFSRSVACEWQCCGDHPYFARDSYAAH